MVNATIFNFRSFQQATENQVFGCTSPLPSTIKVDQFFIRNI